MNILIAEDQEFVHESLQTAFNSAFENDQHTFIKCLNCKKVYDLVEEQIFEGNIIHYALLDICMPSYEEKQLFSGKEVALHIKYLMPHCKIIMMTASMDTITIIDIIHGVSPDGFLYKSDFDVDGLARIIKEISKGTIFRSESIAIQYEKVVENSFLLESINRKILKLIDMGFKIKDIRQELNLTEATINKRIAKMKVALKIDNSVGLLREAKRRGYL
ncbi:hypothetical protein [Flavobacterium sp.]|uniref:hypothetical protein n=1 Tax=Flavobacterium sp. TaxID=239 RepID=UPI002629E43F|nr:hypothetical protein [Flavobacterium sp.]